MHTIHVRVTLQKGYMYAYTAKKDGLIICSGGMDYNRYKNNPQQLKLDILNEISNRGYSTENIKYKMA